MDLPDTALYEIDAGLDDKAAYQDIINWLFASTDVADQISQVLADCSDLEFSRAIYSLIMAHDASQAWLGAATTALSNGWARNNSQSPLS